MNGGGEYANLAVYILLHAVYVSLERPVIFLIGFLIADVDQFACYVFACYLTISDGQMNIGISYIYGIVGWVQTKNLVSIVISHDGITSAMVMAEDNHIEAIHLPGHIFCLILMYIKSGYTTFPSTVKESDDDVRVFFLLDDIYPLFAAAHPAFKSESLPDTLIEPIGNSSCEHTQNRHLCSSFMKNGIRFRVG